MVIALVLALFLQGEDIQDLIEQLRSDEPAVREEATRQLARLGKAAEADLRKAAGDRDQEVAERARYLLRRLEISEQLPPGIKKSFPDAVEAIFRGGETAWNDLYRKVHERASKVTKEDAASLAPLIGKYVSSSRGKEEFCKLAADQQDRAAIPTLVGYLKDADPSIRIAAIKALPLLRAGHEERLIDLLQDPDSSVRFSALGAIRRSRYHPAIPTLIEMARRGDGEFIESLVETLVECRSISAIGPLIQLLKSESATTRLIAMSALTRMDAIQALPDAAARTTDADLRVAAQAIDLASRYRYRPATARLVEMAKDPDASRRKLAAEGLGKLGCVDAIPTLRELRRDPNAAVQHAAVVASASLGDREIIPELTAWLKEEQAEHGLRLFAWLKTPEAIPHVLPFLQNQDPRLRVLAVHALGETDDPSVAEKLVPLLADFDQEVGSKVCDVLWNVGHPQLGPALIDVLAEAPALLKSRILLLGRFLNAHGFARQALPYLSDRDPEVRTWLLYIMTLPEVRAAIPQVVACLADEDETVRLIARRRLRELKDRETVPFLMKLLDHENPEVSKIAYEVIELLDPAAAARELPRLLKKPDENIQIAALRRIGVMGSKEAEAFLLDGLRSESERVRIAAMYKAGELKVQSAVPLVLEILKKRAGVEKETALRSLSELCLGEMPAILDGVSTIRDERIRVASVEIWAKLKRQDRVIAYLKDESIEVRLQAVVSMTSVEELEKLLQDPDPSIPIVAIRVLGRRDDRLGIPVLAKLLRERREVVTVLDGLLHLDAKEAIADVLPLIDSDEPEIRWRAVKFVGEWGSDRDVERLVERLDDPCAPARFGAVVAVGCRGVRRAIPKLVELLEGKNNQIIEAAAGALVRLDAKEAVPEILQKMSTGSAACREHGLRVVAKLLGKESIPFLEAVVKQGPREHRERAVRLLGGVRDERALSILKEFVKSPIESTVRKSLCRLGWMPAASEIFRRTKEDRGSYFLLNGARNVEAGSALERVCVGEVSSGGLEGQIRSIATLAGLSVDLSNLSEDIRKGPVWHVPVPEAYSAWEALNIVAGGLADQGIELILEGKTIKAVSRAEAEALWDKWVSGR